MTHNREELFKEIGKVDAIICTAGLANFGSLDDLTDEDYQLGLNNKLMGQVNLVRIGANNLKGSGSITLTSGVLANNPMPGSCSISMVNAAIEGFTRAASLELKNDIRINTVSPIFVKETMEKMGMDASEGMAASQVAFVYKESVEGKRNGEILDVREFV